MDISDAHALNDPSRTAVVCGGVRFSWQEWAKLTNQAADVLASLGANSGGRGLIVSSNSWQSLACTAALRRIGAITVPLNPALTAHEIRYMIEDSDPMLIAADASSLELVTKALDARGIPIVVLDGPGGDAFWDEVEHSSSAPLSADHSGYMLYTSGTSGKPKGAFHQASPASSVATAYIDAFRLRSEDIHLVAGPLYHSAPAAFCSITMSFGGTVVVLPKFDPSFALELIETEGATTTFMAPILLKRILDLPDAELTRFDTRTLRVLIVAGSHCPFDIKVRAQKAFGDVLFEFYGSTETKAVTFITPKDQLAKPGSCGTLMPGVGVRLIDDDGRDVPMGHQGEILVRQSEATFDRYWADPAKTQATVRDGWVSTGDVAYQDEDGFFYIVDRKGAVVISGGVNIYPAEIESALLEHPSVADAAVIGQNDEQWGERLHAIVVLRGEATGPTLEAYLRQRLAGFKVPRSWEFVEQLGRSDDGKLRKRHLSDERE